jgi:hypothetical protein
LPGRSVDEEDQGADHLIAPLELIHKLPLQLCELVRLPPRGPPSTSVTTGDL